MAKAIATRGGEVSQAIFESDRRSGMASVRIGKTELSDLGYHELLTDVRVDLTDDKADYASVTLRNVGALITDSAIIREGNYMEVSVGYPTSGLLVAASVVVRRPTFGFKNPATITLAGLGEESALMRVKERRVYKGKTYSQIAEAVAERWQMSSFADETDIVLPQVIQSDETDYEFLSRLARKCGRLVHVNDNRLYFIIPGGPTEEIAILLDDPDVLRAEVKIEGEGKACTFASSTPDPLTGEVVSVVSGDLSDGILGVESSANVFGLDDLVARRVQHVICTGGTLTPEEAMNIVEDKANRSKFVVIAHVKMVGRQWMRPKQFVAISGIGRFEGAYMIKRVLHVIKPGGDYTVEFWAVRGWSYPVGEAAPIDHKAQTSGGSLDGGQADVTDRSSSAGSATF